MPVPLPAPRRPATASRVAAGRAGAALVVVLVGVVVALVGSGLTVPVDAAPGGSVLSRPLDRDRSGGASRAAQRDTRFTALGRQPVATWITDYYRTRSKNRGRDVRTVVKRRLKAAASRGATAQLVLYGIPARDCSQYSAGGLRTHAAYRAWVDRVASGIRAVKGSRPIVVIEPDALAMVGACGGQGDRAGSLRYAVDRLTAAGAWTYLDAGHSGWVDPVTMATRLRDAGVVGARGFATNVSNFRPTAVETAYADAVNLGLVALGVGARRYVIDTSRNGGVVAPGEWCNPPLARVGQAPTVVGGPALDALLWVKVPGESDGECGRGEPAAGSWWDSAALRLLGKG